MKKSTPALSHQPPKGIDGEKYESLAGLIEPYADGQFAELLEGLCERVIEAFSPHSWDELTPFQRRSLARDDDAEHDPSLRIDLAAGFHEADYELNHVQAWLTMGAVTPRNATLLFFGQNPSKSQSNLPDMGVDFDLMELSFEDTARDGRARSLNDWLILARSRNLNAVGLDGWEACATIAARATESAPAQTATPVPVVTANASDTPATQGSIMKKTALIAALEYEWPSIEHDISEATRNELKAAAHTGKHGEWDANKARAWAVSKGKIKQTAPVHHLAGAWSGVTTRNTISR